MSSNHLKHLAAETYLWFCLPLRLPIFSRGLPSELLLRDRECMCALAFWLYRPTFLVRPSPLAPERFPCSFLFRALRYIASPLLPSKSANEGGSRFPPSRFSLVSQDDYREGFVLCRSLESRRVEHVHDV